jgi:hypothetical protein
MAFDTKVMWTGNSVVSRKQLPIASDLGRRPAQ